MALYMRDGPYPLRQMVNQMFWALGMDVEIQYDIHKVRLQGKLIRVGSNGDTTEISGVHNESSDTVWLFKNDSLLWIDTNYQTDNGLVCVICVNGLLNLD